MLQRRAGCDGKTSFTRQDAQATAARMNRRRRRQQNTVKDQGPTVVYPCKASDGGCGGWHVAHKPPRVRRRRRTRAVLLMAAITEDLLHA